MNQAIIASRDVAAAQAALAAADRIFLTAGAGLSAAAGFDYTDQQRFAELFPALNRAGFNARYELMGYPLPPRHQWGFWAVHVRDIRFGTEPAPIYQRLRTCVGDRENFVMTSNVDAFFARHGFADVYTPQGDYALYQCYTPCTRDVWDSRPILDRAYANYDPSTGETSDAAVPACPNCGGPVYLNVNGGRFYIADHFQPEADRMSEWLGQTQRAAQDGAKVVVLDIGSGFNTPSVIRWPAEQVTRAIENARLIRVNRDHAEVPSDIADRSFSLDGDAESALLAISGGIP